MITNTQLQLQLRELNRDLNRVFSQQNLMRAYAQHEHALEKQTLLTYAEMVVSPGDTSIQSLLERIHLLITGSSELRALGATGLLELIAINLKVSGTIRCECVSLDVCLQAISRSIMRFRVSRSQQRSL